MCIFYISAVSVLHHAYFTRTCCINSAPCIFYTYLLYQFCTVLTLHVGAYQFCTVHILHVCVVSILHRAYFTCTCCINFSKCVFYTYVLFNSALCILYTYLLYQFCTVHTLHVRATSSVPCILYTYVLLTQESRLSGGLGQKQKAGAVKQL